MPAWQIPTLKPGARIGPAWFCTGRMGVCVPIAKIPERQAGGVARVEF